MCSLGRMFLTLLCLLALPPASFAGDADDCVSAEVHRRQEGGCLHPNPILRLFTDQPAYITAIDNRCSRPIKVTIAYQPGLARHVGWANVDADTKAELIGCGNPTKVLGWCFAEDNPNDGCAEESLRSFD